MTVLCKKQQRKQSDHNRVPDSLMIESAGQTALFQIQ